jgi:acyl-CoA thioesterase-2
MTGRQVDLGGLLHVDPINPDSFRGRARAALGTRVFGGHILAHAVRASSSTHPAGRPVNSLHAHFLGAAHAGFDIDYDVGSLKRGRSFDVDHVVARQRDRPIMVCTISFHSAENGSDYQVEMPQVPAPAALESVAYLPPGTHPEVREPFELRYTDGRFRDEDGPDAEPSLHTWVRARRPAPSAAQTDHAAMLAYAVDFLVTRVAHMPVRDKAALVGASLDHAMWFHRPFRVDDWLLVSCTTSTLAGARSLSRAEIFDQEGHLVATAVQEALLRGTPTR